MKIYFEDGELKNPNLLSVYPSYSLDAKLGVSRCIRLLDIFYKNAPDGIIYTNSIFAFQNRYAWNEELKVPEVYIRTGEDAAFTRIDRLTTRELREGHNLAKMYIAGEFENNV